MNFSAISLETNTTIYFKFEDIRMTDSSAKNDIFFVSNNGLIKDTVCLLSSVKYIP